jgi:hypothetical protein
MYTLTHDQLRIQCIWKTNQGGNDHNHVHVGARPGLSVFLCTRVVQSGRQADGGGLSKQAGGPIAAIVRRRRDAALVRRVRLHDAVPAAASLACGAPASVLRGTRELARGRSGKPTATGSVGHDLATDAQAASPAVQV